MAGSAVWLNGVLNYFQIAALVLFTPGLTLFSRFSVGIEKVALLALIESSFAFFNFFNHDDNIA